MSQLKSCVADVMDRIRRRHDADPGEFWHACLFWTFWVSLALFPIGYGWREVTPPLCFIFLLLYYRHAWHRCACLGPPGPPERVPYCPAGRPLSAHCPVSAGSLRAACRWAGQG